MLSLAGEPTLPLAHATAHPIFSITHINKRGSQHVSSVIIRLLILLLVLLLRLLKFLLRFLTIARVARLGQLLLRVAHVFAVFLQLLDVGARGVVRELGGGVGVLGWWSARGVWVAAGRGLDVGGGGGVLAFVVGVLGCGSMLVNAACEDMG